MTPATLPTPVGRIHHLVQWTTESQAQTAADQAAAAGLMDVTVCRVPASDGRIWGYQFTVAPDGQRFTIADADGRWLSYETAHGPVEALAVYHATGGTRGVTATLLP